MVKFLLGLIVALVVAVLVTVLSIMGIGPMGLVLGFIAFCVVFSRMSE